MAGACASAMATSAQTVTRTMSAMVPRNFRRRIGMGRGAKLFANVRQMAVRLRRSELFGRAGSRNDVIARRERALYGRRVPDKRTRRWRHVQPAFLWLTRI